MAGLDKTVDFSMLRYANCWEDADVLLRGLSPKAGASVLSIGSAGDNCFSLLTTSPEVVVAVDINPVQLHLIALKKLAIRTLDYDEVLAFLGFRQGLDRLSIFDTIKADLDADACDYWERNRDSIAKGVIHQGKFEKYFQFFSRWILPFIHSRDQVERLLSSKSEIEQATFYHRHWDTWRWRVFFRLFFSRFVMGRLGRDPAFLKEVDVGVSSFILGRAEQHLKKKQAQQNPFLRYNLTGNFDGLLPHYLRRENFDVLRSNLDRLILRSGYVEDAAIEFGGFDAMNLSNIFEYMNIEVFRSTAEALLPQLRPGGRMLYWNLMVPRRISAFYPSEVMCCDTLSRKLMDVDNGFFYSRLVVEEKKIDRHLGLV